MVRDDIPFGMRLKDLAGWNQTEADWELFRALRPQHCFVALRDRQPLGTVTTLDHGGGVGWVAMLLVLPEFRRQSIGRTLLGEALRSLEGCEAVGLDATREGKKLYDRLDFFDERELVRMTRSADAGEPPAAGAEETRELRSCDLGRVVKMDREVFGGSRAPLLEACLERAPRHAHIVETSGALEGYSLGRDGSGHEHIGPLVATDHQAAQRLVVACLRKSGGRPLLIDAFLHEPRWLSFLESLGFRKQREFVRMVRGRRRLPDRPLLQWAATGPEFG